MPHLVLEHSDNLAEPLETAKLLQKLHEALLPLGPFEMSQIKSRVITYQEYRVGVGAKESVFVHLTVSVLSGKTIEKRKQIADRMSEVLSEAFAATYAERPCDITVDIREMERETYVKAMNEMAKRVGKG
jgi:5-carboxymethyl-2-hydroxymuconate isomerase